MSSSQQINRIAEEFLKVWESDQSPKIADFVSRAEDLERATTLIESNFPDLELIGRGLMRNAT